MSYPIETVPCAHSSIEDYQRTMLRHTKRQMSIFMDMDDELDSQLAAKDNAITTTNTNGSGNSSNSGRKSSKSNPPSDGSSPGTMSFSSSSNQQSSSRNDTAGAYRT